MEMKPGNFIMAKEMPDHSFSIQKIIQRKKTKVIWDMKNLNGMKNNYSIKYYLQKKLTIQEPSLVYRTIAAKRSFWTEVYVFNDRKPALPAAGLSAIKQENSLPLELISVFQII